MAARETKTWGYFPLTTRKNRKSQTVGRQDLHRLPDYMGKIVIADSGKIRNVDDIELAEKIIDQRAKKDPWEVIDELVKVWAQRSPDDVEAMRINVDQYRESLVDKRYGQTVGGKDQERRFTLAFPRTLTLMIRTQYDSVELPMDQAFYREFGRRYPYFKVSEM